MNLFDALNAHLGWKQRLHDYVEGDTSEYLDTDEVSGDNRCELGQWIHANEAALKHLPEFTRMQELHADFHRCVAEVAGLANRGDIGGAHAVLRGEFAHVSALVVRAISRLDKALSDAGGDSAAA